MPNSGVNLSRCERIIQKKNSQKIYKNLNDLKLVFLELVHLGLYSGKVWENRFFLYCMTLVDPYSKLLLIVFGYVLHNSVRPASQNPYPIYDQTLRY